MMAPHCPEGERREDRIQVQVSRGDNESELGRGCRRRNGGRGGAGVVNDMRIVLGGARKKS